MFKALIILHLVFYIKVYRQHIFLRYYKKLLHTNVFVNICMNTLSLSDTQDRKSVV